MVEYDPFDASLIGDPYPVFEQLRDEAPVYQVPGRGYWVLSRYEDVRDGLRDHERFSSAKGVGPEPIWAPALITTDPPDHTRLRRLATKPFTPRRVERNWGPRVRELAESMIEPLVGVGTVDLVDSLTWPLPVQVITDMIGVPAGDHAAFKHWSDELCNGIGGHLDPAMMERTAQAYMEVFGYFADLIPERRAAPRDDLLSLLCTEVDGEYLDDKEINHFCILLLIAGNETTTNLLGGMFSALDRFRDEFDALKDDPGLAVSAVEEMLRYCSPTQALFRQSTRPIEMHGRTIPPDARVMMLIAAANRDPRRFAHPDRVIVDREPNDHVAFGSGIHFCLGAPLARLEARVVLEVLLEKTSDLRLTGEPKMPDNFMLRGPVHLPAALEPA